MVRLGATLRCAGAHLPPHRPFFSPCWIVLHYPGTQCHYEIRVTIVYLPKVSPGTHLPFTDQPKVESWVSFGFGARRTNTYTTKALKISTRNNIASSSSDQYISTQIPWYTWTQNIYETQYTMQYTWMYIMFIHHEIIVSQSVNP